MNVLTSGGRYSDYFTEEGYKDPTAYKAMKGQVMNEWQPGDIVQVELNNGTVTEMVLLSCHKTNASALILNDAAYKEHDIVIHSMTLKHADYGRITPCYYSRISKLLKAMDDESFNTLMTQVCNALYPSYRPQRSEDEHSTTETLKVENPLQNAEANAKIAELEMAIKIAGLENDAKVARLETERDLYKEWFTKLLNGDRV